MSRFTDLKKGNIYEFVTKSGLTYVGQFDKIVDEKVYFKDVLQIVLRPVQVPETNEISMTPSLEVVGTLVISTTFTLPYDDVYMLEEVVLSKFIDMYKFNLEMYTQAKQRHGSNIEVTDKMPEHDIFVQKK